MLEYGQAKAERDREADKAALDALQRELEALQQPLRTAGVAGAVAVRGWSASGKGRMIARLIARLDPRGLSGVRLWPADGRGGAAARCSGRSGARCRRRARSAYSSAGGYSRAHEPARGGTETREALVDSINTFERQLCDDGVLLLKFFLHIGPEGTARAAGKTGRQQCDGLARDGAGLGAEPGLCARRAALEPLLQATDTACAPWHVIWNEDKRAGAVELLTTVRDALRRALDGGLETPAAAPQRSWPLRPMPALREVDLSPVLPEGRIQGVALKKEKKKLEKLHSRLYREKVPVVLGFEGWDAAGKGGAIRRLSSALDPARVRRDPHFLPVAGGAGAALSLALLDAAAKDGHVALFDRSWYGRVLVERSRG